MEQLCVHVWRVHRDRDDGVEPGLGRVSAEAEPHGQGGSAAGAPGAMDFKTQNPTESRPELNWSGTSKRNIPNVPFRPFLSFDFAHWNHSL